MTEQAVSKIRSQVDQTPPHTVNVIELVSVRFGNFVPMLTNELQRFQFLQMLTLNDCAIKSLNGFPLLPGLIRLDLVFNQIPGQDLVHLAGSRHLQTLMLGGNKVEKIQDLGALRGMRQLFQLDLINNPIQHQPGYRAKVFEILTSLTVLDTLDKSGKDAYQTTSMSQTAARVPPALFDTSRPSHIVHLADRIENSDPSDDSEISQIQSKVDKQSPKRRKIQSRSPKIRRLSSVVQHSHTRSRRAGLVFPVSRIKQNQKIREWSSVYLAAVLEYLTAEVLHLTGTVCKSKRKKIITPKMIQQAINSDEELKKMLINITIPLQ